MSIVYMILWVLYLTAWIGECQYLLPNQQSQKDFVFLTLNNTKETVDQGSSLAYLVCDNIVERWLLSQENSTMSFFYDELDRLEQWVTEINSGSTRHLLRSSNDNLLPDGWITCSTTEMTVKLGDAVTAGFFRSRVFNICVAFCVIQTVLLIIMGLTQTAVIRALQNRAKIRRDTTRIMLAEARGHPSL